MKKFWLIFLYEYKRHVLRKRFIFAVLSMPLFVGFVILISLFSARLMYSSLPTGYVDPANLIPNPIQLPPDPGAISPPVQVIRFASEADAKKALAKGDLQAYFILSENYMSTGEVTMVTDKSPGENVSSNFSNFLKQNIVSGLPQANITRLTEGKNLIIRSLDGTRELNANYWVLILLPLLSDILFIIAVNISAGYLLQAVVEEKENRTMEILATSVSPTQLMGGKITGDLFVGLTELTIWILFAIIGLKIAPQFLPIGQTIEFNAGTLLLMAATFFPAFVMTAGFMGAVGSMSTDMREAQQISGVFTTPMIIPFWFITSIISNPNGPIALGMSLFPFTAPIALPLRAVFTSLPVWQIALSLSLLCLMAVFSLWLAGKVFRLGMLQYGKRVSFREVFRRA